MNGPTILSITTPDASGVQTKRTPKIGPDSFIAPTAAIVGDVTMGRGCSVWFNAVIRGDVMPIKIGDETNIQDGSVVHGTYKKCGTTIGKRVTVGHAVILHGCEIGDRCLIGMGTIIMDNAKISHDTLVGAGSLVTEGSQFPPGVLVVGRPAKVKRELTPEEIAFLNKSADNYTLYQTWYNEAEK